MKNRKHLVIRAAFSAAACLLALCAEPQGQAARAAAPVVGAIGNVDLQKVAAGYTKKAALDQQINDMNARLDAQFKQQVNSPMLTKEQQQQLGSLLAKTSPTDAERAQITSLQTQSSRDAGELQSLQQKSAPSDTEKARLEALTKQQASGQQALQEIAQNYRDQVQAQNEKLSGQLTESIKAAIVAVAQQRGLAVVFDSTVAIYSANDITEDVIHRLNK